MCLSEIHLCFDLTSHPFSEFEDMQVLNSQYFFHGAFVYAANFSLIYFLPSSIFSFFFFPGFGLFFEELLWISEGFHSPLAHPNKQSPISDLQREKMDAFPFLYVSELPSGTW